MMEEPDGVVLEPESVPAEEPRDDVAGGPAEAAPAREAEANPEAEPAEVMSTAPDPARRPAFEIESIVRLPADSEISIEEATERFLAPLAAPAAVEAEPPAEEAAVPGEEPDDGRRWYVVHCYSGYEAKVRHNLEQRVETMGMKNKIFDVVIPTEEEIEVKEGKRRTVERHVFPGYILVQMLMDEDSWYVVRNTPGVTGFVGMGNEPTPLRPEEVAQIIRRMEAEAPRVKVTYKAGQRVRIIDGPFNDFIGTVDEIDMERAKVRVMVSFFGRETPVELDFLQVEKA
jgi:transcriptional antiterminator NusG